MKLVPLGGILPIPSDQFHDVESKAADDPFSINRASPIFATSSDPYVKEIRQTIQSKITDQMTLLEIVCMICNEYHSFPDKERFVEAIGELYIQSEVTLRSLLEKELQLFESSESKFFTINALLLWRRKSIEAHYLNCRVAFLLEGFYSPSLLADLLAKTLQTLLLLNDEELNQVVKKTILLDMERKLFLKLDRSEYLDTKVLLEDEESTRDFVIKLLTQIKSQKHTFSTTAHFILPIPEERYATNPLMLNVTTIDPSEERELFEGCVGASSVTSPFDRSMALAKLVFAESRHVTECYYLKPLPGVISPITTHPEEAQKEHSFIDPLSSTVWRLLFPSTQSSEINQREVTKILMQNIPTHPALKEAVKILVNHQFTLYIKSTLRFFQTYQIPNTKSPAYLLLKLKNIIRNLNLFYNHFTPKGLQDASWYTQSKTTLLTNVYEVAIAHIESQIDSEENRAFQAWRLAHRYNELKAHEKEAHIEGYFAYRTIFLLDEIYNNPPAPSICICDKNSQERETLTFKVRDYINHMSKEIFGALSDLLLPYAINNSGYLEMTSGNITIAENARLSKDELLHLFNHSPPSKLFDYRVIGRVSTALNRLRQRFEEWNLNEKSPLE